MADIWVVRGGLETVFGCFVGVLVLQLELRHRHPSCTLTVDIHLVISL